jgi:hypothetical protein
MVDKALCTDKFIACIIGVIPKYDMLGFDANNKKNLCNPELPKDVSISNAVTVKRCSTTYP